MWIVLPKSVSYSPVCFEMSVTADRLGKDNVVNGNGPWPTLNNEAVHWEMNEE